MIHINARACSNVAEFFVLQLTNAVSGARRRPGLIDVQARRRFEAFLEKVTRWLNARGEIGREEDLQKKHAILGRGAVDWPREVHHDAEMPAKESIMPYYFGKILPLAFDQAVQRTTEMLKEAGFGIITDIDVKETLKKKINADFRNYRILGACNPALAHEALQIEDKVGTMLPCNVVLQDLGGGRTEVAAIDPVASMLAIENPRLRQAAERVQARLKEIVERL